jgi:hypothetical protein
MFSNMMRTIRHKKCRACSAVCDWHCSECEICGEPFEMHGHHAHEVSKGSLCVLPEVFRANLDRLLPRRRESQGNTNSESREGIEIGASDSLGKPIKWTPAIVRVRNITGGESPTLTVRDNTPTYIHELHSDTLRISVSSRLVSDTSEQLQAPVQCRFPCQSSCQPARASWESERAPRSSRRRHSRRGRRFPRPPTAPWRSPHRCPHTSAETAGGSGPAACAASGGWLCEAASRTAAGEHSRPAGRQQQQKKMT